LTAHFATSALAQPAEEYAEATPKRPGVFGVELVDAPVTRPALHAPHSCEQPVEATERPVETGSVLLAFCAFFEPLRTASIAAVAPPSGLDAEVESPLTSPLQPSGQSSDEPVWAVPETPAIGVGLPPFFAGGAVMPVSARVLATASDPTPQPFAPWQRPEVWERVFAASPYPLVNASP
jgi:hypothetical protein